MCESCEYRRICIVYNRLKETLSATFTELDPFFKELDIDPDALESAVFHLISEVCKMGRGE